MQLNDYARRMTENELEAWMSQQREKRRLKLIRRQVEASIDRGAKRTLVDSTVVLGLLERLGA